MRGPNDSEHRSRHAKIRSILLRADLDARRPAPPRRNLPRRKPRPERWNEARSTVLAGLAADQYQNANFEKSRATIDQALRLSPDNAAARLLSAKLYIEAGSLEAAEQELTRASQSDSARAEAEYLFGVVYQRWQQPQRALECYQHACDKSPAELAYVMAKAEMLVAMGRHDEALTLLQSKVAYFEHSGEIRDEVGLLLIQDRRYPEAIEMLRRAGILSPDDLTIREHLAMALFYGKQFAESADLLSALLSERKMRSSARPADRIGRVPAPDRPARRRRAKLPAGIGNHAGSPPASGWASPGPNYS